MSLAQLSQCGTMSVRLEYGVFGRTSTAVSSVRGRRPQRAEVSVEQFAVHAADCAHVDGLPSRADAAVRLEGITGKTLVLSSRPAG